MTISLKNLKVSPILIYSIILFLATEIRCQEKSKGGLKYEVIMAEPNLVKSQAPIKKESHPKQLSAQEIEEKLKAAEQRRLVINQTA